MGMSINVVGIIPPDEQFLKMKSVYDACIGADIPIPEEVNKFFNDEPPDEKGVVKDIAHLPCCNAYVEDMRDGFEIDITKLPEHIKIIRFYNSY